MHIFLVRHAIAVERTSTMEDASRPLAQHGVARFAREVRGLQRLEITFEHVFHSPWLRAAQTAELLAPVTEGPREATTLLADDPGGELLALAQRFDAAARIAFVGHQPWMGELLSLLVMGSTRHGERFPFKKGGIAWLKGEPRPGAMRLRALFTPKSLRRLDSGDDTLH